MTSIIEQADSIVGITEALGTGGFLDYADKKAKDTYRRGAYVEWLPKQEGFHGFDAPGASSGLEELAAHIVRLHAASKPKGDGLPDDLEVRDIKGESLWAVGVLVHNVREDAATKDYLRRCLTQPVRRLLAAFDVVEKNPNRDAVHIPHVVVEHGATAWNTQPDICWLVPRGER